MSGVNRDTIREIEGGQRTPNQKTLTLILSQLRDAFSPESHIPQDILLHLGYSNQEPSSTDTYVKFNNTSITSLGKRLTALRRLSLQTLTDLGGQTGISPPRIYAIEQNKVKPSESETIVLSQRLAYGLAISQEEIIKWLAGDTTVLMVPKRLTKGWGASGYAQQHISDPPPAADQPVLTFGLILRRLRERAGVSEEYASAVLHDDAGSLLTAIEAGGAYGKTPLLPSASYLGNVGELLDCYRDHGVDVDGARRQVADWWIAKHEQRIPHLAGPDAIAAKLALFFCQQEKRSPRQVSEQLDELKIENATLADVRTGINIRPESVQLLDLRSSAEATAQSELRSELSGLIPTVFSQHLIYSSSEDLKASSFRPTDELRETWRKVGDVLLRWRKSTMADDDESQLQLLVSPQRSPIRMDVFDDIEQGKGYLHLDAVELLATSGILSPDSKDIVKLCRKEKAAQFKKYDSFFVYSPGPPTGYGIDLDRYSREISIVVPETEILNLPRSEATSQLRYLLNLQRKCGASESLPNMTLQLLPEGACGNFPHHIRAAKPHGSKQYCAIDSEGRNVDWYLTEGMGEENFHSGSKYVSPDDYIGVISPVLSRIQPL